MDWTAEQLKDLDRYLRDHDPGACYAPLRGSTYDIDFMKRFLYNYVDIFVSAKCYQYNNSLLDYDERVDPFGSFDCSAVVIALEERLERLPLLINHECTLTRNTVKWRLLRCL